jgi:anaerobic magnesium-protoporphyrin IX monomethyl ester cyclase
VEALRKYADWLDPDIATFMVLTPFPGTEVYSEAKQNGWIEDKNWANYDMIHAVMPTEHLSRLQVQEELHRCYDDFFGSWPRRYRGIGSKNPFTRRTYLYLAQKAITTGLRNLF